METKLNTLLLTVILLTLLYHELRPRSQVGRFVSVQGILLLDTTNGQVCMPPTIKESEATKATFPPCKPVAQ
jgi:hypothetical protein